MVLRFHVTYKLAKHVIELQADTGIVSDITEIIYEKFNIQKRNEITLQYYEKDFEDWVNLELNSSLQNMMKLKVEAVVRESSDSEIPDVPAESADNVHKVTGQHINTEIAVENCNLSTATTTRLPRPWPTKFIFPAYALRAGVVQKLESGEQLSRADRSQVTDAIYNEVTKYTYYPKEWQYTEIVTAFLEKFPKLNTGDNLAKNLWRQRIQYRFQNDRRRKDSKCIPGKRVISGPNPDGTPKKQAIMMWGLKNYLSKRPDGEDDTSINRHKMEMKTELSKRTPNKMNLDRYMDITFADRREFIVKNNPSLEEIKEEYPVLLSSGDEVLKEFRRISLEALPKKLKSGIQKKLFLIAKHQHQNPKIKELVQLASQEIVEENREAKSYCASIAVVPILLKEKLENLITEKEDSPMSLYIHQDNDVYTVMLEGERIFSSSHLLSSFEIYLACYYVFNISYPKPLKKTLQFFQRPVLNIQDKEKVHPSVYALLDKLN